MAGHLFSGWLIRTLSGSVQLMCLGRAGHISGHESGMHGLGYDLEPQQVVPTKSRWMELVV